MLPASVSPLKSDVRNRNTIWILENMETGNEHRLSALGPNGSDLECADVRLASDNSCGRLLDEKISYRSLRGNLRPILGFKEDEGEKAIG